MTNRTPLTLRHAQRAMTIASRGTSAQVDAFEDEFGGALSSILDELWAMAEDAGRPVLAGRLERAFNRLAGHGMS
jgi:hypothetical protein